MENPIFTIETSMEKGDYKKFLFIAAFLRNPFTIPLIACIALIGACLSAWINDSFTASTVFVLWGLMFLIAIAVICFKILHKNKQRVRTDQTGTFGNKSIIKFYDDKMILETPSIQGTCTLTYQKFYQLLESKEYFIFYLNMNQASLIRKKDIPDFRTFQSFLSEKFVNRYKCCIFYPYI